MENNNQNGSNYSRNGKNYYSPIKMLIAPEDNVLGTIDLDSITKREEAVALARKTAKLRKKFHKSKGRGA